MGLMAFLQWGNPLCASLFWPCPPFSHPLCLSSYLRMAVYLFSGSTYFQALNSRHRLFIWPAKQWTGLWPNQSAASPGPESASPWPLICPWEATECPNHLGVWVSKNHPTEPEKCQCDYHLALLARISGRRHMPLPTTLPGSLLKLVILWPQPLLDLTQGNKWVLGTGWMPLVPVASFRCLSFGVGM